MSLKCVASSTTVSDARVQKAIDAIVQELYARKDAARFWEPATVPVGESPRQTGGHTALVVWALLHAGQSYQDERLQDVVAGLENMQMQGTYAISVRCNVWAMLPDKFKPMLQNDAQWLMDSFSDSCGGWDYVRNPNAERQDNSLRQFGALALWEASKRGVEVDRRIWKSIEQALIKCQLSDGGWNYSGEGPATGSMTAAGLASLYITQGELHSREFESLDSRKPEPEKIAMDQGLEWLNDHFSVEKNPGKDTYFYYYLWGIERVGLASGRKRFGGADWYAEGAGQIITRLCEVDSHGDVEIRTDDAGERDHTIKTDDLAMGLLFLSRGRVPVADCKLVIEDQRCENRPLDADHFAGKIAEGLEQNVNWQLVTLTNPIDDWLDAPFVYFASDKPLQCLVKDGKTIDVMGYVRAVRQYMAKRATTDHPSQLKPPIRPQVPEASIVKNYLDRGGMLLAVNEGGSQRFAESVEKLGLLMYPQYEWRVLEPTHWAYSLHEPVTSRRPILKGLSNGVRDLIIIWQGPDLAKTLQSGTDQAHSSVPTAMNLFLYASEKGRVRPRLRITEPQRTQKNAPERSVRIVRAIHAGNWKPEPQAIDRFADWILVSRNIHVEIADEPLGDIGTMNDGMTLAMICGTEAAEFSAAQRNALAEFLHSGGVAVFENSGGSGAFTKSCADMFHEFSADGLTPLGQSPIVTGKGLPTGVNASRCDYRPFTLETLGKRETSPRLTGMNVGEHGLLIVSAEDLSQALLDQPCWGVNGYTTESARILLGNIVEFVLQDRTKTDAP
ncbi:MAG TPA: hypothetical protein VG711_03370 [Phycisphaerales bacterium]|nr:hypothetical protein [Phycisphaerales bacterium]